MKKTTVTFLATALLLAGCGNKQGGITVNSSSDSASTPPSDKVLSCKLTSPELQKRKETVIDAIKKEILEKKELKDGYAYKFNGTDSVYNQLTSFIGSERQCCDFFTFNLKVQDEKSFIWMEITGPEGAKEMLTAEAGL